jgi:chromosome segregation ATPase
VDKDIWKQRNEILHKKVNRQMDEIKKLNDEKETIFDLARKYPNKTYVELEAYRDADRREESQQISLSESQKKQEDLEPIEGEEQDNTTLFDVARDNFTKDLKLRETYEKEHKLRQEAEGELSIMKGIETNRVKEAQVRCDYLQSELDRVKKDNNDLFLRIAELTEVEESHRKTNGKLQERLTEVEEDNKRISKQVEDQLDRARKAGL